MTEEEALKTLTKEQLVETNRKLHRRLQGVERHFARQFRENNPTQRAVNELRHISEALIMNNRSMYFISRGLCPECGARERKTNRNEPRPPKMESFWRYQYRKWKERKARNEPS